MVWRQLKLQAQHLNIYTSQLAKAVELIRNVCDQKITKKNLENYVLHVMKEQNALRQMFHYHMLDNEIKPQVIDLSGNNDSVGSEDELV